MSTVYELPLTPTPQTFRALFPSGRYFVRFIYCDSLEPCWLMDLSDAITGDPIIAGVPLVPGVDLLEEYAYLNFNFKMWCTVDGDPAGVPNFDDLGTSGHVWIETDP